jgi:hypothetical protein
MNSLEIESIQLADLKLDPKNARTHSGRNIDAIKESLERFGQRKPIVVAPNGTVVAGNGTVVAARELGWSEVSASRIPKDWSAKQITAYAIADNRTAELAAWDTEILIPALLDLDEEGMLEWTGFTQHELENWDTLDIAGGGGTGDSPLEGDEQHEEEQGSLLAIADVTVGEPKHVVENSEIWSLTMPDHDITHVLVICNLIKEWSMWNDYLQGDAIFIPFPDPFITHSDAARKNPMVMVQPDNYLAGHLLDKHAAAYGPTSVLRLP